MFYQDYRRPYTYNNTDIMFHCSIMKPIKLNLRKNNQQILEQINLTIRKKFMPFIANNSQIHNPLCWFN